jgi:deoxycytidine triphosphate deaminase
MTLLNDRQIFEELSNLESKDPLIIHPILDKNQVYGAKVDLRIDNELFRLKQGARAVLNIDSRIILNRIADRIIWPYGEELNIIPGEVLFAYTFEFINMPRSMIGRFEARARLAKVGLFVSSGMVDPGFSDHLLLTFFNASSFPIIIRPLMRVVSMSIERIEKVKTDFQVRPNVRPRLDSDELVISVPDYDSNILGDFVNIKSMED